MKNGMRREIIFQKQKLHEKWYYTLPKHGDHNMVQPEGFGQWNSMGNHYLVIFYLRTMKISNNIHLISACSGMQTIKLWNVETFASEIGLSSPVNLWPSSWPLYSPQIGLHKIVEPTFMPIYVKLKLTKANKRDEPTSTQADSRNWSYSFKGNVKYSVSKDCISQILKVYFCYF